MDAEVALSGEQEYSVSTKGLLCLISSWAGGNNLRNIEVPGSAQNAAQLLLKCLTCALLGGRSLAWTFGYCTFKCEQGRVPLDEVLHGHTDLRRALHLSGSEVEVEDLMIHCAGICAKSSRLAASTKESAQIVLGRLLDLCTSIIELGMCDYITDNLSGLPSLKLRSTKPRRISSAHKRSLQELVADSRGVTSIVALCSSASLLASATGKPGLVRGKSAKKSRSMCCSSIG